VIVSPTGELDLAVVGDFEAALSDESLSGAASVVVDLCELEFMDSSGLRVLLLSSDRFGEAGTPWAVAVREESAVSRLLSLSEVADRLPLHRSLDAALAAVSGTDGADRG
jgi:anti-sigma B factor antagonist